MSNFKKENDARGIASVRHFQVFVWGGLVALLLVGCATSPKVVNHGFGFDARWDSKGIKILDYRYGTSSHPSARNGAERRAQGESYQTARIYGEMRVGDDLYVKWRDESTGEIHEDMVDLRSRLPDNMTSQDIYFIVEKRQLYVYLISRDKRRPSNIKPNGPEKFHDFIVTTIYPDQPTHQEK